MEQSLMYAFLLNMWMMRRIDETFLNSQTPKFITIEERNMILVTPQNA